MLPDVALWVRVLYSMETMTSALDTMFPENRPSDSEPRRDEVRHRLRTTCRNGVGGLRARSQVQVQGGGAPCEAETPPDVQIFKKTSNGSCLRSVQVRSDVQGEGDRVLPDGETALVSLTSDVSSPWNPSESL